MCGIIGAIAEHNVSEDIISGLKKLEYRGYDSAGIAVIKNGKIEKRRSQGKLIKLEQLLRKEPLPGHVGIGHTRWATHGIPSEANAHPHATDKVAVVHNGIIENFAELKKELESKSYKFTSQTDTEVVPQLITYYLDQGDNPEEAIRKSLKRLKGAFALGIIFSDNPNLLVAARKGSPLAIGYKNNEKFIGSDAIALSPFAEEISYLEDGDWALLTRQNVRIYDKNNKEVARPIKKINVSDVGSEKGNYQHYMLKEIFEQMHVTTKTLEHYYDNKRKKVILPKLPFSLATIKKITLVACGTSFYACMVAKYWFENFVKINVDIDIASEYRYRNINFKKGGLVIFVSQSGETADTLAAMRYAKENGQKVLGIVNVPESTISREADAVLYTYAGVEIGVASTKVFTTQLIVMASLVIATALKRKTISEEEAKKQLHLLSEVPSMISEVLNDHEFYQKIAADLAKANDIIYIGRGTAYAIALEGALKLKEISYIHAEANAAGELKHGSIALIDEKVPVIVIAPKDHLFEKTASNAEEVAARKGKIYLISSSEGLERLKNISEKTIKLPETSALTMPIIYAISVQLLAYYTALAKGADIDQPRNLAKSVTVE